MAIGDHYSTLGVERTASAGEIRKAYLSAIRLHTPENDAEKFNELSEAYAVLSNVEKRRNYDAEERLSPMLTAALESAAAMIESDADEACEDLERLARENPDVGAVLQLWGYALLKADEPDRAVGVFKSLTAKDPENAGWHVWTGIAYKDLGPSRYGDAETSFKAAISIDKTESAAYLHLSEIAVNRERHADAIAILDRGISADGSVDAKDLPLFKRKLTLLALSEDWRGIEVCGNDLKTALLAEDEPTRAYAADFLADFGNEFIEELKRADLAFVMHSLASDIHPESSELRDHVERTRDTALTEKEKHALLGDESVPEWIRTTIFVMTGGPAEADEEKACEFLFAMVVQMAQDSSNSRRAAVSSARRKYPRIFAALATNWNSFESAVRDLRSQNGVRATPTPASPSGSTGCLILFVFGFFAWWLGR